MEEKKEEAKQEEVKQEQPKPQQPPADEKPKKNKKINNMNLAEIEEKLKISRENMGTHETARYVQELLKRRKVLMKNKEPIPEPTQQ